MAVSAFKSTSKRGNFANPGAASSARQHQSEDMGKKIPSRRSRSVSAVSRSTGDAPAAAMPEFLNKRDNPLFCSSSASPTDSEKSVSMADEGGEDGSGCRQGRPASRSSELDGQQQSSHRKQWGRSLSRVDLGRRRRSVSRGHYGNSESELERDEGHGLVSTTGSRKLGDFNLDGWRRTVAMRDGQLSNQAWDSQTSSTRHPLCEDLEGASSSVQVSTWDDGISTSSFSEAEEKTIKAVFEQMKSFKNEHPLDSGSGIYETVRSEVRRAMSEIRSDLENAIHRRDISVTSTSNSVDASSGSVRPDAIELVTDIRREYAIKLQQTQERARKLRADLDVEEHRSQELSKILKEMLPDPKHPEMERLQTKRKASIERHKMSRRLTEEAMNYFDECVSISTFDTSDFSSPEDQFPNSLDGNLPRVSNDFSGNKNQSSSSACIPTDPVNHSEFDPTQSRNSQFSFSMKSAASAGVHEIKHYIRKFGKESQECDKHLNVRSSYNGDDYDLNVSHESLLFEKIILRNRIDSGSLLICDIRTV